MITSITSSAKLRYFGIVLFIIVAVSVLSSVGLGVCYYLSIIKGYNVPAELVTAFAILIIGSGVCYMLLCLDLLISAIRSSIFMK